MKFIYFGTPDFSARLLERMMRAGMIPAAVVTNPDRPVGRKKIMTAPPVARLIQRIVDSGEQRGEKIEILQPEKLDAAFMEKLKSFGADVFVVFAYNKIFRKEVLVMPRLGVVGIHPSLLPQYRGPSPFQSALLHGETETGVTLYRLDEGIDSGPIIAVSDPVLITDKDTFISLAEKLANVGADLLIEALPKFIAHEIVPKPQNESLATFTKKFKTEDGFVTPEDLAAAEAGNSEKAAALGRKIRALNPEPGVWTMQKGKRIKLLEGKAEGGKLYLIKIQEEGQKPRTV